MAPRLGIEHEFQIFNAEGSIDARAVLPRLPLDGKHLDPGDPFALRCRWGGVITADGREAEIATPPVHLSRGGLRSAVELANTGRAALAAALEPGNALRGYSTHLNVEVDDRVVTRAARLVAERMAPAIMLLLDRSDSPGLIVRPRHARLEFGGEFASGKQLLIALTMACGVALVAEQAVRDRSLRRRLPPVLDIRLMPTPVRFGWYVDRRSSGDDLYSTGRPCRFQTRAGRSITADAILHETWSLARHALEGTVEATLLSAVDAQVADGSPLPRPASNNADPYDRDDTPTARPWPTHLVDGWRRGTINVDVVSATWYKVILRAVDGGETRWVTIPGEDTDSFVSSLRSGELDAWLNAQFSKSMHR